VVVDVVVFGVVWEEEEGGIGEWEKAGNLVFLQVSKSRKKAEIN